MGASALLLLLASAACHSGPGKTSTPAPTVTSTPNPGYDILPAPIHEVKVSFAMSYPPQVFVYIKGGLADTCSTFHDLTTDWQNNVVNITVTVQRQKDAFCGQVYTFFEKNVNLGSGFVSGQTYTVNVNDQTTMFKMP